MDKYDNFCQKVNVFEAFGISSNSISKTPLAHFNCCLQNEVKSSGTKPRLTITGLYIDFHPFEWILIDVITDPL